MFRRERPQKGRYRQFYQIGAEAIGSDSPPVDAEVIEMVMHLLAARRASRAFELLINSVGDPKCRARVTTRSCGGDWRERGAEAVRGLPAAGETNPLRVLDCKVPEDQPIIETLPSILDYLCESAATHFDASPGASR